MLSKDRKSSKLFIQIHNDHVTFAEQIIGTGVQLRTMPAGTKVTGVKLDSKDRCIIIEYERG